MANSRPLPPSDINPWAKTIETDVDSLLRQMSQALSDASTALRAANAAISGLTTLTPKTSLAVYGAQAGITTATAVSEIAVSVSLASTTNLRVDGQLNHYATTTDTVIAIRLMDGATVVASWFRTGVSGTAGGNANTSNFTTILPNVGAGTHNYTLQILRAAGTGSIGTTPTTESPTFLAIGPL